MVGVLFREGQLADEGVIKKNFFKTHSLRPPWAPPFFNYNPSGSLRYTPLFLKATPLASLRSLRRAARPGTSPFRGGKSVAKIKYVKSLSRPP